MQRRIFTLKKTTEEIPHVIWLTGLSGAGKSTLACALAAYFDTQGQPRHLLDGDEVRRLTSRDLGFSQSDRIENIRRMGQLAKEHVCRGKYVVVAAISPYREARNQVRALFSPGQFIEVFIDTPLAICETRDPKGLYRKARAGEIQEFTGIDSPFEPPLNPEVHLRPDVQTPQDCLDTLIAYLQQYKD